MRMQLPPGHLVQQIADENGILTHVILSPQPPTMMGNPMPVSLSLTFILYLTISTFFNHTQEVYEKIMGK